MEKEPAKTDIQSLEEQGWHSLEQEQYDDAIRIFGEIFKTTEGKANVAAFQGTIAAHREKRDFARANELLAKALLIHSEHPGILSERAWLFLKQQQYDEAIGAFDAVLKVRQTDEGIFLWEIFLLRRQRRFDEAKKLIDEATHIFPQSIRMRNERGWLHFDQMQYDDALEIFGAILGENPNEELALQGRIASLRMKGLYAEATKLANKALSHPNKSPGIYSERGWISFEQGDYDRAEEDFKEVLKLTPGDPFPRITLAWSLVRQETDANLDEATKLCREALSLEPNLPEAFGCLGNIAFKQGRVREAESYFIQSIRSNPKTGNYADLGALYIQMGRYEEAKENLDYALKNNPDNPSVHIEMGNLYLQTERTKEAVREFRLATVIDPRNPGSFKALAIALLENGNLIEAEKVLRDAIRRLDEFKRWELHLTLCRLLSRLGDETNDHQFYEEALEQVNLAKKLKPRNSAAYFHGGIIQFKLDDHTNALKDFNRCLRVDKYHFEAALNARRVRSLMRREKARSHASTFASLFLTSVFLIQLAIIWFLCFKAKTISETTLTILLPIVLGLLVVAVVLPWLSRLKMTGLEAELSEPTPKESLPAGPKGEIGFSSAFQTP